MIDLPTRRMTTDEEGGTFRVPVDGIAAIALRTAYGRLVAAQDEVVTIQAFLCREKGITPDQVVGFDDERGELLVRP
jgi:hypothetical protein